jgi:hypothetical protein
MTQLKKNTAKRVLQGIAILGMLLGLPLVLCSIPMIFAMLKDDLAHLCFGLFFMGFGLVLGSALLYSSYRLFRGTGFGAIKSLPAVLAFSVIGLTGQPLDSFATPLVSGIQARTLVSLACFLIALLAAVLVYSLGTKLLQRLADTAYGPPGIAGMQPSPDKQ